MWHADDPAAKNGMASEAGSGGACASADAGRNGIALRMWRWRIEHRSSDGNADRDLHADDYGGNRIAYAQHDTAIDRERDQHHVI